MNTLERDLIICRSILRRRRNVSDKSCTKNQNVHFMFNNLISKIVPFYDLIWKKYGTAGEATDDNMAHAFPCRIPKATNTHLEYIILIAFPLQ